MLSNYPTSFKFKRKFVSTILVFIFLTYVSYFAVNVFRQPGYYPIRSVKVFGVQHTDPTYVQQAILPVIKNGFFYVDVDQIKERLLAQPWIAETSVRRIWPDRLIIKVNEKKALSHWNGVTLLSESGQFFNPSPATYPQNLPEFVGPEGKQKIMSSYFRIINALLEPIHVSVNRLELTEDLSWKLTLNNNIKLYVGHKDVLTRISRFVKVYPKIIMHRQMVVDYLDLRYSNGIAVKWKPLP